MGSRATIYGDTITFEDDSDTVRINISDRKGAEVEIIFCTPKFVDALKGAEAFWAEFQDKRARQLAEQHVASLPKRRKTVV